MLDLRTLPIPDKPVFTSTQLAALIGTFREAGFGRHQRLAVLYRTDPHGGARTFAVIGRIQGWQVRAFKEFEAAWLWMSEETIRQPARGESDVPIRVAKHRNETKKLPIGLAVGSHGAKAARPVRRAAHR